MKNTAPWHPASSCSRGSSRSTTLIPSPAPGMILGAPACLTPSPAPGQSCQWGSGRAEPHGSTLQSSVSASWSCRRAEAGRGPRDAPRGVPQEQDGKTHRLGWLQPAVPDLGAAFLHSLICIGQPLFALINVSVKCLMYEISFLLAGIGGAVWDSCLLCFRGQESPDEPVLVLLSFWLAVGEGFRLGLQACSSTQKPRRGQATV